MSQQTETSPMADAAYVPHAVIEWVREGLRLTPGETTQFNAAVLYIELDKLLLFDPLNKPPAPERLAGQLDATNGILADVIQSIHQFGGVVAVMDSEALVAYFPHGVDTLVTNLARNALTCALDLKYLIRAHQQTEHANTRIGLAYGLISVVLVGHEEKWKLFVTSGSSLEWARVCARQARRGQIVAASNIISPLSDAVVGEELLSGRWLVTNLIRRAEPPHVSPADGPLPHGIADALRPFLDPELSEPGPAYKETLCMYVMFEGVDYNAPNAGRHLQEYVQRVDAIAAAHSGRLDHIRTGDRTSRLRIIFDVQAPRQAVACALALRRGDFATEMEQRIGAASGHAFVGVIGDSHRRQLIRTGGAVARAAKLADQAQPGEVLIDAQLQAQTESAFIFHKLTPAPFERCRLEREQSPTGDLDARYLHSILPVVDRSEALETLEQTIQDVRGGQGRIVAITGPAGMGKSRLAEVLVQRWFEEGGRGYGGMALPHTDHEPLTLWVELWRDVFGLARGDDSATMRDKLDALLRGVSIETGDTIALLGPLVGIDSPTPAHLATLDAQARQARLFRIGIELVIRLADYMPLLLILENMQWADASTLAFLERLAPVVAAHPVLLCLVGRGGPYVKSAPHVVEVVLAPLRSTDGWKMLEQHVGEMAWPALLHAHLSELLGAPGSEQPCCSPLFVEETVRCLRTAGALAMQPDGEYVVNEKAIPDLPGSLDELLDMRLAQLSAAERDALQAASVVGYSFDFALLEAILPEAETAQLDALIEAGFLLNTAQDMREDRFRHMAMQATAYRSIPDDRRRALHASIAEAMSQNAQPSDSLLAYHYDAAGMLEKAAAHAVRAARRAQAIYANVEALYYYGLAEKNVNQMEYEGQRWPLYVQISLNRGRIYLAQGEFMLANADAGRALHLATTHRDRLCQTRAFNLMATVCNHQKRYDEAVQFAEDAARIARVSEFKPELINAWRLLGQAYMRLGRRQEALHRLRHALTLAREYRNPALVAETAAVIGEVYAGNYYMIDALEAFQEAMELIRPAGDQARLAECLIHLGEVYLRRGEGEKALNTYQETIDILRTMTVRRGTSSQLGQALRGMSQALCFAGRYTEAREYLDEAEAIFQAENDRPGVLRCLLARGRNLERDLGHLEAAESHLRIVVDELSQTADGDASIAAMLALADVYIRLSRLDEAASILRTARTWIELERAHWYGPEYERLSGSLAVAQGNHEHAITHAHQALALISGRGDPCTLPQVYLMLARALQATRPTDTKAIRDAYDRAMRSGRGRARKLDQATTLWELGQYLKKQDTSTNRARGVGFIFESESLFNLIGLRPFQSSS